MLLRKTKHIILIMVMVFSVTSSLFSQFTVTNAVPYNLPANLVQNVLLGNGIVATNITFNGNAAQIGYFNNGLTTNLGINEGIILSSGDIQNAIGPNNQSGASTSYFGPGDADLGALISPISTNDAAVLEFDFIPTGDTARFRYVFASEEYMEYVGGGINDAFGFFLTGVSTAFPTANIALLPGTTTPVSIDNVSAFTNASFYQDNGDGFSAPYNSSNQYIQYDGQTVVLEAVSPVICGETYHIKIAIADGSDWSFDSGVMLEAGSFASAGVIINAASSSLASLTGDTVVFEGCGDMSINFSRGNTNTQDSVYVFTAGIAGNGIDYVTIADTIILPIGQQSDSIIVSAISDGLIEGYEDFTITLITKGGCSASDTSAITLYINDLPPVLISVKDDTLNYSTECNKKIGVEVLQGIPQLMYLWSTGETTDSITVNPLNSQRYSVTVTDSCGVQTAVDSLLITVMRDPIIATVNDTSVNCPNDPATVSLTISGGSQPYNIIWDNGATDTTKQNLFAQSTTTFQITITDQCGVETTIVSPTVFVPIPPLLQAIISTDTLAVNCPGETVVAVGRAEGGFGQYQMTWDNWNTNNKTLIVSPTETTTYYFEVQDYCNSTTITVPFHVIVPIISPLQSFINYKDHICPGDFVDITTSTFGGASGYTYEWSNFAGSKDSIRAYPEATESSYSVAVTDKCGNTVTNSATVIIQVPVADFNFQYQTGNLVEFTDNSSTDVTQYLYEFSDGSSVNIPDFSYSFDEGRVETVLLNVVNQFGCKDSISKKLIPPFQLFTPNSFSPNGDGKNDIFYANGIGFEKGSFKMVIYNRWGNPLITITNPSEGWDGKDAENGSYIYQINVRGFETNGAIKDYISKGIVTLIR